MTFNQTVITKYVDTYKELYLNQHGHNPKSWFSFFRWLGSFSSAGAFGESDIVLASRLLGIS